MVAEERPQGTTSSLLELYRRRLQISYCQYGVRELQPPRSLLRPGPTGRFGQEYKTKNEYRGGRTQGGEQRDRGLQRHRDPKLCRTRRGEYTAERS